MTTTERAPERTPDRASVRYGTESRDPRTDDRSGGDWSERLALRNWSLPVKLAAVLLVPTMFVLVLGVLRIVEQTDEAASFDSVQQAVSLEDRTSQVLDDLAAERSAAAVYVASGRAGGSGPVEERIGITRDATSELRRAAGGADSLDQQTIAAYDQANGELDQLDRLRDDVIDGRVDAAGAIARYTETVDTLEVFDRSLSREAADPSVAGLSAGLYSLSVVREEDAYIQAVVAAGVAAGRIDAPSIDQARKATLRRSIAVDDFRSAVGTDNAGLADAVVGPDVDNRDLLAEVVFGRGAAGLPLQVSGPDWERASGAVDDQVDGVAEQLRGQLQGQASALQQDARNGAGVSSVILLLALLAGAAVVFFVTRSLLRPLRLLRRTALDVAERRLPRAVRSLREGEAPDTTIVPTPITTREEIGQVARAFDQVHEQAVRLAAEQAGLRAAFNSIFINLSRRSQALVERQLKLIEQLENSEEDPEALSNLFQLDHLATRMRRNSENLLVLSGTDLSRRGSKPVPLVDVLRAAASEVEQYPRIDLAPPPQAQLLGRTANDVVHLVAELLENATTFSAPDTRVEVRATQNADGGVLVEIVDSGVGMSEEDLHEANTKLDSPPTVDVSASRRMGLFVVGRLATRHGIAVSLRNRDEGGVVATALVPASAVLAVVPEGAPAVPGGRSRVPEQGRTGTGLPQRGQRQPGAGSFFSPGVDPEAGPDDGARPALPRRGAAGRNGHPTPDTSGPGGPRDGRPRRPEQGPPRRPEGAPAADAATEDEAPEQGEGSRHGLVGGAAAAGSAALIGAAAARRRRGRDREDEDVPADDREAPEPADDESGELADQVPAEQADTEEDDPQPSGRHVLRPSGPPAGPPQRPGAPVGLQGGPAGPGPGGPGGQGGPGRGPRPPGGRPGGPPPGWRAPGAPAGPPPGRGPAATQGPGGPPRGPAAGPPMWNGASVVPPPGPMPPPASEEPDEPEVTGREEAPEEVVEPVGEASSAEIPDVGEQVTGDRDHDRVTPGTAGMAIPAESEAPAEDAPQDTAAEAVAPLPAREPGTTRRGTFPLRPRVVRPQPRSAEEGPAGVTESPEPPASDEPVEAPVDTGVGAEAPPHPDPEAEDARDAAPEAPAETPEAPETGAGEPLERRASGRRLPPSGVPFAPGLAPRLRPRRPTGSPAEESAAEPVDAPVAEPVDEPVASSAPDQPSEDAEMPADAGGLPRRAPRAPSGPPAPSSDGGGALFDPAPAPNGSNGHTTNDGSRPGRATPERLPTRAGAPRRERTPIYDEVASAWFREASPAAGPDEGEWASSSGDEGWRAAAATADALDAGAGEGTTESGLPRRRPRAHLVPGAARPEAPSEGPALPRRSAEAIRGRLASYQQGVTDGRTTRRARPADTVGEPDARPGDEEEQ